MKVVIVSDIHGNVEAMNRLLEYVNKNCIDKILNLGDIMGGTEPIKVLRKIMEDKRFINVCGNHDESLEFIEDELSDKEKLWLKMLPMHRVVEIEGIKFLMIHSRINSNRDIPLIYNEGLLVDFLKDYEGEWDYVLFGHTHYQCLLSFYQGKTMINPGSLGLSYDNKTSFAVLNIDKGSIDIKFKKIKYDIEQ